MPNIAIDMRMIRHSGIGTYLRHLVPGSFAHRTGCNLRLLGNPQDLYRLPLLEQGRTEVVEWTDPIYSIREQLRILRSDFPKEDIFWAPHYNIPLFHRGKVVVTVHDVFHLAMPELVPGLHRRLYAKGMFRAVTRRADRIICVSEFSADELVRFTGVDRGKIRVIPNGVDASWFEVRREQRPHEKPYMMFVGNVKPNKNLSRLVEAFDSVKDRIPHDLVIVGKKEGFITADKQSEKRATRLGDRVRFTGFVDEATLKQYFAHATALIFPSLYEGFGLPPLEAMACGCPVIVSDRASLPEVCGGAALYVDPYRIDGIAGAMRRLAEDGALQGELRQKGAERARHFSWKECAAKTFRVFEELLDD